MAQQQQKNKVGWIGLGGMGIEMASNLQKHLVKTHGHPLTVWNRSPEKSVRLANEGAVVATSIESLLAQSNVVFTSLFNGEAVEAVYSVLLEHARLRSDPIIFVETSTIYPTFTSKIAAQMASSLPQHRFLQCPVFGRPTAAAAAQLIFVTSGHEATITSLRPYFESMSRAILDLNTEDVSQAGVIKLVGNFLVAGSLEIMSEAFALAAKNAVGEEGVLKMIELIFPAPVWLEYSKLIAKQIQSSREESKSNITGAAVTLGLKDVGYMRQLAKESGARLPTADVAYQNLKTLVDRGHGDEDWSSLINALQ